MRVAELRFLVRAFDAVIMLANCRLNDVLFWTAGSPLGWFSDALEPVTKPQLAPVWRLRSGPVTHTQRLFITKTTEPGKHFLIGTGSNFSRHGQFTGIAT